MKYPNGTKNPECYLFIMSSVCLFSPSAVVSGLSNRAQQHHIDMKIAPQIIFYENVARGSGSIMASSNVISIPQSCKGVSYLKMCMDYFALLKVELVKIRVSIEHVRQMGWKIISVSAK